MLAGMAWYVNWYCVVC